MEGLPLWLACAQVDHKPVGEEGASAVRTGGQGLESTAARLLIVGRQVVAAPGSQRLRFLGQRPPQVRLQTSIFRVELFQALRLVDVNGLGAELAVADVADDSPRLAWRPSRGRRFRPRRLFLGRFFGSTRLARPFVHGEAIWGKAAAAVGT